MRRSRTPSRHHLGPPVHARSTPRRVGRASRKLRRQARRRPPLARRDRDPPPDPDRRPGGNGPPRLRTPPQHELGDRPWGASHLQIGLDQRRHVEAFLTRYEGGRARRPSEGSVGPYLTEQVEFRDIDHEAFYRRLARTAHAPTSNSRQPRRSGELAPDPDDGQLSRSGPPPPFWRRLSAPGKQSPGPRLGFPGARWVARDRPGTGLCRQGESHRALARASPQEASNRTR